MLNSICEYAVKEAEKSGATEAEAYAMTNRESEVLIENNDIKQAKSHTIAGLGIRIFVNRRLGFSYANTLTQESIKRSVTRAMKVASVCPEDKFNVLPIAPKKDIHGPKLFDQAVESFTVTECTTLASEMLRAAKCVDNRVSVDSGNFTNSFINHSIYNSNGVCHSEKITSFFWSILGMAIDGSDVSSFDVQTDGCHMLADVNVSTSAESLAKNTLKSLGAKKIDSFNGDMILSPYAVSELLLETVAHSINSDSVQKKTSRFQEKIGKLVSSDLLTIDDDPTDSRSLAAATFDREGVPHSRTKIIESGILKSFLYNTYTAAKDRVESTGNAAGGPNTPPVVSSTNLVISPGSCDLGTLVAEVNRGIVLNRFSGNVNPISGEFSGVVKGGHYILNGEIIFPVREVMIAGNVFEALANITGLSRERKCFSDSVLPHIRIENIAFIGQ
ncbi:MAG TPA: TldD/PmbA family protein [Nitrososphaeraceae archaeon]|jgi:PmbA protein